ncbi:MAG: hypothetical protein HZA37_00750 [Parcubacteria group bacterium]|nr:hypothetical protein [Parcubacteria group bacterium]
MSNIFRKQYDVKLPRERTEAHEFKGGLAGLTICSVCGAVYYKKSWRAGLEKLKLPERDYPVKFALCPACRMIKNGQYEGRIIVKNIPPKARDLLVHLIEAFCRRAQDRDQMDRLIKIGGGKDSLEVFLTENQLANKLAKKIKDAFNKVGVRVSFAAAPGDVVNITVVFGK